MKRSIFRFILIYFFLIIFISSCTTTTTNERTKETPSQGRETQKGEVLGTSTGAAIGVLLGAILNEEERTIGAGVGALVGAVAGLSGEGNRTLTTQKNDELLVVVRDFLKEGHIEYPYYGYYTYLIFTEETEPSRQLREMTAKEFMCQLGDASDIGIPKKNVAVFYAPVKPNTNVDQLKMSGRSNALLENYNYTFSEVLLNTLRQKKNIKPFKVGVVAYPSPLIFPYDDVDPEYLEILDLSKIPPVQSAYVIRKLRESVISKNKNKLVLSLNAANRADFATEFRKILFSLGKLITSILPIDIAEAAPCR